MKKPAPYTHKDGSNCHIGSSCFRNRVRVIAPVSTGLTKYKTEQVGISFELAIADIYGVNVNKKYRERGDSDVVAHVTPAIKAALANSGMPLPTKHIAEGKNPVDFELANNKTLSAKSNMKNTSMVCPQKIGQPTPISFWTYFSSLIPNGMTLDQISKLSYEDSGKIFKKVAFEQTSYLLTKYWENLFDCDYLLYISKVLDNSGTKLSSTPNVTLYKKPSSPKWKQEDFTFTGDLATWKESITVKYKNISIGDWQIHDGRKCFKFRFNIKGLIKAGLL